MNRIARLLRRGWFKRSPKIQWPDSERVTSHMENRLGDELRIGTWSWRYACAGEDLKNGRPVEPNLSGRLFTSETLPESDELSALIYGDVRATAKVDQYGTRILGWPSVDVKKGRYFWLTVPPPGSEFEMAGKPDGV